MRQGSRVAEAAVQNEAAECVKRGGEEDMSATEEGIPSEDGAATRDSSCTITKAPAKRVSRHDQEAVSGYIFSI